MSATTRRARPGEHDGVDYHFLDDEEFEARVQARASSSSTRATPAAATARCARTSTSGSPAGRPVVLEIEVQGARQVRETMPEAVQVFIAPPSEDALRARLVGRGTDDAEQVEARLATAREELEAQDEFAHVVVNDRLEDAVTRSRRSCSEHLAAQG